MKKLLLATVMLAAMTSAGSAEGRWTCVVADPTRTPLNVRIEPNNKSKIIGTLKNGTKVYPADIGSIDLGDKDNRWILLYKQTLIPGENPEVGWVFVKYLKCP